MVFFGSALMHHVVVAQQIVAHRGASHDAPENSLAAVRLGYEQGADAVEVDIHLSKDQRIMVNHDKDTQRTAGEKFGISETNSSELRKLDVGTWKAKKFRGEKMPFLEEVLDAVPAGKRLVIEIKAGEEIVPVLKDVIQKSGIENRLIIISFNRKAIIEAKAALPEIPAYWLLHTFQDYTVDKAIEIAKTNNLDGLDVHYPLVTKEFMQTMNQQELEVYVYTVNNAAIARKLSDLQVNGITTDRPQWLREQLTK